MLYVNRSIDLELKFHELKSKKVHLQASRESTRQAKDQYEKYLFEELEWNHHAICPTKETAVHRLREMESEIEKDMDMQKKRFEERRCLNCSMTVSALERFGFLFFD